MTRVRYLIKPPTGFCAPFVVTAESAELALAYGAQWLGKKLPNKTHALVFLTHDNLSCMFGTSDTNQHHTQQGLHA